MAPKSKAKAPKKAATAVKKTIAKPSAAAPAPAAAAADTASVPKGGVLIEVRTEKKTQPRIARVSTTGHRPRALFAPLTHTHTLPAVTRSLRRLLLWLD